MKTPFLAAAGLAAALLASTAAAAQTLPQTEGVFIGLYFNGITLSVDGGEVEHGPGAALTLGYGFTPAATAFLNVAGASAARGGGAEGRYNLGHADLGLRFSFATGVPVFRPYALLALTGTNAEVETGAGRAEARGAGITLGSGINAHVRREFALEAGLQITLGQFTDVDGADGGRAYRSGRFQVGGTLRL